MIRSIVSQLLGKWRCRLQVRGLRFTVRTAIAVVAIGTLTACADSRARRAEVANPTITGSVALNPDVLAANERLNQSAARVDAARSALFPTLDLNAGVGVNPEDSSGSDDTQRSIGFRIAMPLFNGFSNLNSVRGARAEMQAAEQSYDFTRDEAIVDLVSAIAEVERDQKAVGIRETEFAGLNRFLNEARQRQTAGIISATDVHQIETQLEAIRTNLSQARAVLQTSRARRTSLAGVSGLGDISILDIGSFLPASKAEAIAAAVANNASLKESGWRQEAASQQIGVAEGAFLPNADFSVNGDHNPDRNVAAGISDQDDLELRIDISIPLFDGGGRRADVALARSAFRESSYLYQAARRDLVLTVQNIWAQTQAAREITRFSESRLASARDAFTGVRDGRRIGARSVRDELEARNDVQAAELSLYDARYTEIVAQHQLLLQMGIANAVYGQGPVLSQ